MNVSLNIIVINNMYLQPMYKKNLNLKNDPSDKHIGTL